MRKIVMLFALIASLLLASTSVGAQGTPEADFEDVRSVPAPAGNGHRTGPAEPHGCNPGMGESHFLRLSCLQCVRPGHLL